MNKFNLILTTTFLCGTLCGCSENGFFFRSNSDYDYLQEDVVYYVGEPYRIKGVLYTPAEDMNYSEKGVASWYSRDTQNRLTTNGEVFDDDKMTAAHKTLPLPSMVRITNLSNGNTAIVRVNDRGPAVNNRLIDVSRATAEALEMSEIGTTPVQVDILPEESRRLKASLEEFTTNEGENMAAVEIPAGDVIPVYQPASPDNTPIYNGQNETKKEVAPVVAVATLPPIADQSLSNKTAEPVKTARVKEPTQQPKKAQEKAVPTGGFRIQAGVFGQQANADLAMQKLGKIAPVSTTQKGNLTTVYVGPFKNKAEAQSLLAKVRQMGYSDAWVQSVK